MFCLLRGSRRTAFFLYLAVSLTSKLTLWADTNVLTVNYDNARTNSNLREQVLNTTNVNAEQFGKLFVRQVDGQTYAQPLFLQGVEVPGKGLLNVVYVVTMHNSVYAFDADAPESETPLWHIYLGPAVPTTLWDLEDVTPEIGILSTPVIDASSQTIYLVSATLDQGKPIYRLHALDTRTGAERPGAPALIQASVRGTAPDSHNNVVTFDAAQHLQRPGLLLLNGVIYVAFGSHEDQEPYHGWLIGYSAANVQRQAAVFVVAPNGGRGSIWQAGRGPAADDAGNIYIETANGDFDNFSDWGESFLRLSTDNGLSVADWFAPEDWLMLNANDFDLGSCGPVLIPGTDLLFGGGKFGDLFVLDRNSMGHIQAGNVQIPQHFQAVHFGIFNLAYWNHSDTPMAYLWGWDDYLTAFQFSRQDGVFNTTPVSHNNLKMGFSDVGLTLSANGSEAGSGILWVTETLQSGQPTPGTLHAYDAADLSRELWNSNMNPQRDVLGAFAKFANPTVANGRVYVPTFSNQLVVYGLLDGQQSVDPGPTVWRDRVPTCRVVGSLVMCVDRTRPLNRR